MRELDVDGGSGKANPGLRKQMLQKNAWHIISRDHKTNEYVCQQVDILAGRQKLSLPTVKRRKLSRYGHVCHHDSLPNIMLPGTVDGSRSRGRLRKSWKDNING